MTKLYEYRLLSIGQLDDAPGWPGATVVKVAVSLAPPGQGKTGHEVSLVLRFPRNDDLTLSTLRQMVAAEVPRILRAAADLTQSHIPETGENVDSAKGLEV